MSEKITFVVNGELKKKARLKSEVESLLGNAFELDWQETRESGHGIELARLGAAAGSKYLVAVGGDGTVNEVVNGVMQAGDASRQRVIIGVLAHGTGNDFARTIQAGPTVAGLKSQLEAAKTRQLDLLDVNFAGRTGQPGQRFCNNITDIGIGGDVVMKMSSASKALGGGLAYVLSVFRAFLTFKHKPIRVTAPEYNFEGQGLSVVMANCTTFGSGLIIAPQARPDDSLIQLVVMAKISVWDYIMNLGNVKKGKILTHKQVFYAPVSQVKVETPGFQVPLDMDGEFVGFSPVEVKVVPLALRFLVG
ncbi:MAG: diacylglycerol kinase family lipid kinase [Bacteroidia bacterium]|nr:diacylglycerol kinase family lipid kinase [Bacteroidia bacterium]